MYQLNVHLQPGDLTREGHPYQCWDRCKEGKAFRFHVEHYEGPHAIEALDAGIRYWRDRGVKVSLGEKTAEVIGQYKRIQAMLEGV